MLLLILEKINYSHISQVAFLLLFILFLPLGALEKDSLPLQIRNLEELAKNGNADIQYNLGVIFANGREVEKDLERAAYWFNQSSLNGNAKAQYKLGYMYEKGLGVQKNIERAVKQFLLAAQKGDADAQYNLGIMYKLGNGVEQDHQESLKWYKLASVQGHSAA